MADTKETIIKGQAYICGTQVCQDVTVFEGTITYNRTDVLIKNIWENLFKDEGTHKIKNQKKSAEKAADCGPYWYWEFEQTTPDTSDNSMAGWRDSKCYIEPPMPTPELMRQYKDDAKSLWAEYWKLKFREVEDSEYFNTNATVHNQTTIKRPVKDYAATGLKTFEVTDLPGEETIKIDNPLDGLSSIQTIL